MYREEIIRRLKKYFDIQELVSQNVYDKVGDNSWFVFDLSALETLLEIREDILNVPMTINNYMFGGKFTQRGFRENISQIVKDKTKNNKIYLSGHPLGKAFDFTAKGLTANEVRIKIYDSQDLLTNKIRLEASVKWVHFDTKYYSSNDKVYLFNV